MEDAQSYFTLQQQKSTDELEVLNRNLGSQGLLHSTLIKLGAGIDTLQENQTRIASASEKQAEALNALIWPNACTPLMLLTLGVDVNGSFNLGSRIGLFLTAAVGCEGFSIDDPKYSKNPKDWQPGLQQLAPAPASGKPNPGKLIGREAFLTACLALQKRTIGGQPEFCIPQKVTEKDFGRFYDCARDLLGLIE
jgi:hypothetical protein